MEVKEKSRKRELIKSIAIVFLAVLLVLTFFSNTIMNRSLPEVASQNIASGTINARIRGSGTVSANESFEVIINQTRQVRSVCVGVGDHVQQGDLLFVLENVESQELVSAQEQLDNLNLQYEQQLLTLSRDYASEDRAIQVLREDLEKATEQRDENKVTEEEITYAKGDLTAAKNELKQIGLALEEMNALMGSDENYAKAKEAVTKWQSAMDSAKALVDEYTAQLNGFGPTGSLEADRKIPAAQDAVNTAKNALSSNWMAYKPTYSALVDEVKVHYTLGDTFKTIEKDGLFTIDGTQRMYVDAYLTEYLAAYGEKHPCAAAYDALISSYADLQTKTAVLNQLNQEKNDSDTSVSNQKAAIQTKLNQASYEYTVASQQLQQANYTLQQAESQNTALKNQIKAYEATQRQQTAQVEAMTEYVAELESKKVLYDQAVTMVSEKERAITDALTGKNIDRQLDDLSLQSIQKQIDKAQKLVDKYTADSVDTEIRANVGGLITAIHVTAGKETSAGVAMATIDVVDRGYTIRIPVTNEQARQVKVGDTADVTNYYWGGELEAVLESVIADPANPGKGKLLVFRITGEIDAGTNITLSIGQRSANYDTVIPKSALRQDTNGYFVLVITVKSSPLSNRYIATRVDVNVLAEDDTSAAVTGLNPGDFVITTSSKPVEAGSQVRMVENP